MTIRTLFYSSDCKSYEIFHGDRYHLNLSQIRILLRSKKVTIAFSIESRLALRDRRRGIFGLRSFKGIKVLGRAMGSSGE